VGYPKLREEWVINALCDGSDAQDWERESMLQACDLNSVPHSSSVLSAQPARSKWAIPATRYLSTHALYSVLPEQRMGLLRKWVLKSVLLFCYCNTAEKCSELHHMLACEQSHEHQAGGDGPRYGTFRVIKEPCYSVCVSFSIAMFQCLLPLLK